LHLQNKRNKVPNKMKYHARVDENQKEIVACLRKAGAQVQSLAAAGSGVPDLLVGFGGLNFLMEIKNPKKPKSARGLTPSQIVWHGNWQESGQVAIIETCKEALALIGVNNGR